MCTIFGHVGHLVLSMLTPAKLRELRHRDWVVDNRQISADTGWKPRLSLEAGLKAMAAGKAPESAL